MELYRGFYWDNPKHDYNKTGVLEPCQLLWVKSTCCILDDALKLTGSPFSKFLHF